MTKRMLILIYTLLQSTTGICISADTVKPYQLNFEQPFFEAPNTYQHIIFEQANNKRITIAYSIKRQEDTAIILQDTMPNIQYTGAGMHKQIFNTNQFSKYNENVYKIIKQFNTLPFGQYVTNWVAYDETEIINTNTSVYFVDSLLSTDNKLYIEAKQNIAELIKKVNSPKLLETKPELIDKKFQKSASQYTGLRIATNRVGAKLEIEYYYQNIFIGKIVVNIKQIAQAKADQVYQNISKYMVDQKENMFNTFRTQTSENIKKVKELLNDTAAQNIKGDIEWRSVYNTQQDPYSIQQPYYSEIQADLQTQILKIPLQIQAYTTTQDIQRKNKVSYFRIKYDFETVKSKLNQFYQEYNKSIDENKSKLFGLNSVYTDYLKKVQHEKDKLQTDLNTSTQLPITNFFKEGITSEEILDQIDTAALRQYIIKSLQKQTDSNELAQKVEEKYQKTLQEIQKKKAQIQKAQKAIQELQEKYEHFQKLQEQYKVYMNYDSVIDAQKKQYMGKYENYKNTSINDLYKKGEDILEPNQLLKRLKGINNLELGMFNKSESKYTLNNQLIKGANIEYQINKFEVGITLGNLENMYRNGDKNVYRTVMSKVAYAHKNINTGIIYFGYSPGKNLLQKNFYQNLKTTDLSITQPSQVISYFIDIQQIAKSINTKAEIATSHNFQDTGFTTKELAYTIAADYKANKLPLELNYKYENVGQNFNNPTLLFLRKGTSLMNGGITTHLWQKKLKLKLEANQLKATDRVGTTTNTKWGFEIATKFKRYPNITLSYKPFTTFRALDDTLVTPQQQLFGNILNAKLNYTYKDKPRATIHSFNFLVAQNISTIDTISYKAQTINFLYAYMQKTQSYIINIGAMKQPALYNPRQLVNNKTISISANNQIQKKIQITNTLSTNWRYNYLDRLAYDTRIGYPLKKYNTNINLGIRYVHVLNPETISRQNIWGTELTIRKTLD